MNNEEKQIEDILKMNPLVSKGREKRQTYGCFAGIIGGLIVLCYFLYFIIFDRSADFWPFAIGFILMFIGGISSQSMNNDVENAAFKEKGIDKTKFINSGKYLSGHSEIDNVQEYTFLYLKEDVVLIYYLNKNTGTKQYLGEIPKSSIKNISLEDETSIQNRVGLKRMLALGIFAFAIKKKVKQEIAYLIIEWNKGSFLNETVFEFEGTGSVQQANILRNKLINSF